jgi:hypothetical protein
MGGRLVFGMAPPTSTNPSGALKKTLPSEHALVALTRDDVAVAGLLYKQRMNETPVKQVLGICTAAALASMALAKGMSAVGLLSVPVTGSIWIPVVAACAALRFVMHRHRRQVLARVGLKCPSCGGALVGDRIGTPPAVSRHEKVLGTGCCPTCGAELFGT